MSDYQKEFWIVDNKIAMSFSKPHESAYGASVNLTASEAREVAKKLNFYAEKLSENQLEEKRHPSPWHMSNQ
ncbi:hypothetical protein ACI2I3_00750 [Psychrobacter namhaensis]|uniref:Uncharacterized protein n=1 Tax=Psychrobacter namhaensis TaxID=292734 RepID=A0ABW8L4N3_9GAMM